MKRLISGLIIAVLCVSCGGKPDPGESTTENSLDALATDYLALELSMGQHDPAHVDAYFGPEEIAEEAGAKGLTLDEIKVAAVAMQADLAVRMQDGADNPRVRALSARVDALLTRLAMNSGEEFPFDTEATRLFGTTAPDYDDAHFDSILEKIDELLPGDGPLAERVDAFQSQFVIPVDKLPDVFSAAIAECRKRTLEYIDLPEGESFTVEYVNDKPWSGYNWYQGEATSLIQVNTDLPIFIHRAVDLGCHEGYPGHHTFNVLLEQNLVTGKGWLEYTLYPLFSPASLIAEGSGNYGIELAFPGSDRLRYERDVLFPMAGLDVSKAGAYYELLELQAGLKYADNEAARDYLNGVKTREETIEWLTRYTLTSPDRSAQRTRFIDTYRSYVINYNLGKDMVKSYVESGTDSADERWARFEYMLSTPMLPADLLHDPGD